MEQVLYERCDVMQLRTSEPTTCGWEGRVSNKKGQKGRRFLAGKFKSRAGIVRCNEDKLQSEKTFRICTFTVSSLGKQ